jgi:EamA-like transporter family
MSELLKIASDGPSAAIPSRCAQTTALTGGICALDERGGQQAWTNAGPRARPTFRTPFSIGRCGRTASCLLSGASPSTKTLGGIAMILAMCLFVLNFVAMNTVLATMPVSECGILVCPLTLVLALVLGQQSSPAHMLGGAFLLRVGFDALNAMMFLTTLILTSFANDIPIQQSVPLFMVVYACFALGERLGWRQIGGIFVGFAGALFVTKPGVDSLGWDAVLAFGAAISIAAHDWKARAVDPPIVPLLTTLSAGLVLTLGVAAFSLRDDRTSTPTSVRFDELHRGFSQGVRTAGRQMVVSLQPADGL